MKITILNILILLALSSCGLIGTKEDLFERVDLSENADWLLVHEDNYGFAEVINNSEILKKYHKDLSIRISEDCRGTTPDYCYSLYKNGKAIQSLCYCSCGSWLNTQGKLKKHFIKANHKKIIAYSISEHNLILDSLKRIKSLYLLYPKDTIIKYPNQLKFEIKLFDSKQDIFDQEKPIENQFRHIFKNGDYSVEAKFYLSEAGNPRKLGYKIFIDCDSSFLKIFDKSLLSKNELFKEMTDYKYINKEFEIFYYEWK